MREKGIELGMKNDPYLIGETKSTRIVMKNNSKNHYS